eukprot:TRINITY_DN15543_c0_g2_i1.p1 TRINITY_DN15543_c0_g2~~TRINITY_DN15543_c0_g2_i1.p1  ORF type:complete len:219 (+),score=33.71 TRINITY_DN15543_c0_g2_i1:99-755(+)
MASLQLGLLATMPQSQAQDHEKGDVQSMNPYAQEFNPDAAYAPEFFPGIYDFSLYAHKTHLSEVAPVMLPAQESKMTNMFSTCPKDAQTSAINRPVPQPLAIMSTDLEDALLHSPEKASVAPTLSTWTPASTAADGSSPSEDKASSMQSSPKSSIAGGQRVLFSRAGTPREPSTEGSRDCEPEPISRDALLRARALLMETGAACSAERLISTYKFQWQ